MGHLKFIALYDAARVLSSHTVGNVPLQLVSFIFGGRRGVNPQRVKPRITLAVLGASSERLVFIGLIYWLCKIWETESQTYSIAQR